MMITRRYDDVGFASVKTIMNFNHFIWNPNFILLFSEKMVMILPRKSFKKKLKLVKLEFY